MQPGMPENLGPREMEMIQTSQFYQQLAAVKHSKHQALETCFDKCMDPEDLRTARRRDLDERKRNAEYAKEKTCMKLCHAKYQKAFSMAVDGFRSSELQMQLANTMEQGALSLQHA
eukprot:TRINITY_DN6_c7_g1_i1.p1 TRINITY_DN6_c7_g1~~TRINITY_DN6_c7_g1_i1.p1  ORF type:complete len:116 (+),score=30.73 TRINITY_DN6_c7_g1_i1:106-453(+)